jgi:hypothetical protein
MPRYYFVVSNDLGSEVDRKGLDLPGNAQARQWALTAVREIRNEDRTTNWADWRVDLLDATGTVLLRIPVGGPDPRNNLTRLAPDRRSLS